MSVYKDGLRCEFEKRYRRRKSEFPANCGDLVNKFQVMEEYLNKNVHNHVNTGPALHRDGRLTDHGADHIIMVMDKAYEILGDKVKDLTGYEIFILLIAIHIHDIGNIWGRVDHEEKLVDIMNEIGGDLGIDNITEEIVVKIAESHGGYADTERRNKDTLHEVPETYDCNGKKIRPALLASILRFADELSDDCTRAAGSLEKVPEENQIYHAYSSSLEPITISEKTVSLRYRIPYDLIFQPFKKDDRDRYLYDEILDRLLKCLRELDYCRKYAEGFINVKELSITIIFLSKDNKFKHLDQDAFKLGIIGYPCDGYTDFEKYVTPTDNRPKYHSGPEVVEAIRKKGESDE